MKNRFSFLVFFLIVQSCKTEINKIGQEGTEIQTGKVHIIDNTSETFSKKLLAVSLQGIINQREARIYLLDRDRGINRPWEQSEARDFWLNYYKENKKIEIVWQGKLDEALKIFATEINGYILASESEPWTINAATTLSGLKKGLIVTENDLNIVEGFKMLEDLRGRWKSAEECYFDMFEKIYSQTNQNMLGIITPKEHNLRDFLIQRKIFTLYAKPQTPDWDTVKQILNKTRINIPVFGYMSDTGIEEYFAVETLSREGKYLIPSDTTPNLSFHSTVKSSKLTGGTTLPSPSSRSSWCEDGKIYVTVAISDGDNLAIPLNVYISSTNWLSSDRGKFPMGWSISPYLSRIAPSVAEYYLNTATENDELVGMLGIGYVHPSFYPDMEFFVRESLKYLYSMGMKVWWTLDPALLSQNNPTWDKISKYIDKNLEGFLVGYFGTKEEKYFRISSGQPVILANTTYSDTATSIGRFLREQANSIKTNTYRILFISASVWSNSFQDLYNQLSELNENRKIIFAMPSQILKCVP
mgnify:CR=1 FL=1